MIIKENEEISAGTMPKINCENKQSLFFCSTKESNLNEAKEIRQEFNHAIKKKKRIKKEKNKNSLVNINKKAYLKFIEFKFPSSSEKQSILNNGEDRNENKNNSSNQLIPMSSNSLKCRRKIKYSPLQKKFICKLCEKKYMTNSSLYSHIRNKHSIVTVTKRDEIFSLNIDSNFHNQKVVYNYLAAMNDCRMDTAMLNAMIENIKKTYLFLDEKNKELNIIPKDYVYAYSGYGLIKCLEKIKLKLYVNNNNNNKDKNNNENNFFLLSLENNLCIDFAFVKYLIIFKKVIANNQLFFQAILFTILFREYLNISGYDLIRKYSRVEIPIEARIERTKSFCETNTPELIPEFVNDFNSVFLSVFNLDGFGPNCLQRIKGITTNFCNWLYINNLTNFKVIPFQD